MDNKVVCSDLESTKNLARNVARSLKKDDIVLFYGDLGAGKTFFVKEICANLKIPRDNVTSPSFNIVKTYKIDESDTFVHHFDLYRLGKIEEVDFFEFEDYFNDKKSIVFIEWADRLNNKTFPGRVISITIKITGAFEREIFIDPWILSE